jgi:hypothetical protein
VGRSEASASGFLSARQCFCLVGPVHQEDQYAGRPYSYLLEQVRADKLVLPNFDLDSGQATKANKYSLDDGAYAKLLARA